MVAQSFYEENVQFYIIKLLSKDPLFLTTAQMIQLHKLAWLVMAQLKEESDRQSG